MPCCKKVLRVESFWGCLCAFWCSSSKNSIRDEACTRRQSAQWSEEIGTTNAPLILKIIRPAYDRTRPHKINCSWWCLQLKSKKKYDLGIWRRLRERSMTPSLTTVRQDEQQMPWAVRYETHRQDTADGRSMTGCTAGQVLSKRPVVRYRGHNPRNALGNIRDSQRSGQGWRLKFSKENCIPGTESIKSGRTMVHALQTMHNESNPKPSISHLFQEVTSRDKYKYPSWVQLEMEGDVVHMIKILKFLEIGYEPMIKVNLILATGQAY